MRQWGALGVGLLCGLLAGCVAGPPSQAAAGGRGAGLFQTPPGLDMVQLEVALLECPVGDAYINNELWALADEQIIGPERKAVLEENGFRVAQVGGIIPDELLTLLTSKRSNVNPRRRHVLLDHPAALNLGPAAPLVQFRRTQDGQPVEVELTNAQCQLVVVPSRAADGKMRLRFTPQVEHGERLPDFHPAEDGSGWVMEVDRPSTNYPDLSWEMTLTPNQYVVVGARFDQRDSLGYASFVAADPSTRNQRLLVIRMRPPATQPGQEGDTEEAVDDVARRRSPPLALQAQTPGIAARASGLCSK
jgi:hypothetical protein